MPSTPSTPRRTATGRRRGRPPGTTNAARAARLAASATEPPPKRRKYIPGGPGGGGRFIDEDGTEVTVDAVASASAPRPRASAQVANVPASSPLYPRRERSTRTRSTVSRYDPDEEQYSSAAAVAAAVAQSEGYKPREERGWEEFHPHLDIEATFMIFHADDVDGVAKSTPPTPSAQPQGPSLNGGAPDALLPSSNSNGALGVISNNATPSSLSTPPRRRVGRPPRDSIFYGTVGSTPKTPRVLPIHNQTPKEKLDLKLPSYRKTDRIQLFESKKFGQARYVDKAMMNVGYQESDNYFRPERRLIKANDTNGEDELEPANAAKPDGEPHHMPSQIGRVEYDMDEQDDMWLEKYNIQRKAGENEPITREIFEITITKIEKEWHALEKRIPKPNPKPPQTHRPRSSSAAAVNGETQAGEEQDSKCAICDDGDCENTNAIVFCDGCDLAVHQECYGVPFIPEGQWLCRKCQLIGRGIPTCIFCPNTEGAFKQTNSSKWAHLLCAMWIPEVSLGNHTFMEPVMEVEKVPKNRWKLKCYLCQQSMGACIQCGNKACYEAFHVTCARRAHLYLKMKNSHGTLAVLDGSMVLKAFCHKHCPPDYAKEHNVKHATKAAMRFYKKTMKGRIWVNSQATARELAATYANQRFIMPNPPDESQATGAKLDAVLGDKKKGQPTKALWKLPSGAPIIPQAVFDLVESSLQRFTLRKRKEFVADACRYWTLKREARRGAALLKRLQLQMETFSSMELTRRNFAAMGPSGKARLARRIEFAKNLINDLEQLKSLADDVVKREEDKLEGVELEQDFVDTCYFPIHKLLLPVVEKAISLDKDVFHEDLAQLQTRLNERFYTTTLTFTHDLCEVIRAGISSIQELSAGDAPGQEALDVSPSKVSTYSEARDRKRLGKRILKAVQPQLEAALKAEADINHKSFESQFQELERRIATSLEAQPVAPAAELPDLNGPVSDQIQDVIMADVGDEGEIVVADAVGETVLVGRDEAEGEAMDLDEPPVDGDAEDGTSNSKVMQANGMISSTASVAEPEREAEAGKDENAEPNGVGPTDTPPADGGYIPVAQPALPGPLTPPQSNGSVGRGPADPLNDGGIPWYMKGFSLEGTSAAEEQWTGRDAVRSLSEDLTDMDDEELNGLEFDVEDSTITASPVNDSSTAAAPVSSKKKAAAAKFRKGIRSSTRRR